MAFSPVELTKETRNEVLTHSSRGLGLISDITCHVGLVTQLSLRFLAICATAFLSHFGFQDLRLSLTCLQNPEQHND